MLWITKLTNSGLSQDSFGVAFKNNVKRYNKYDGVLTTLKKQLKDNPGDAEISEKIEVVKDHLDKLNRKLCTNIELYIKNPGQVEKNRERMKTFHKAKAAGGATSATEPPASAPTTEPPAPASTEPPVPTTTEPPKPAATTPPVTDPPKTEPKKTTTPPTPAPPKKKSNVGAAIGWSILAFIVGGVTGYSLRK